MTSNLRVREIRIVENRHIYFHTTLPEPCWPYEGELSVHAIAADAREYINKHFPDFKLVEDAGLLAVWRIP